MKYIKQLWTSFLFAMLLLGIFYVPIDLQGVVDASKPWKKAFRMLDQNTLLWIFSVASLGYIIYRDALPLMDEKKKLSAPIKIDGVGKSYRFNDAITELVRTIRDCNKIAIYEHSGEFDVESISLRLRQGLMNAAALSYITIYGKRDGINLHEKINSSQWRDLNVDDDIATDIEGELFGDGEPARYFELAISSQDLGKIRKLVKKIFGLPKTI